MYSLDINTRLLTPGLLLQHIVKFFPHSILLRITLTPSLSQDYTPQNLIYTQWKDSKQYINFILQTTWTLYKHVNYVSSPPLYHKWIKIQKNAQKMLTCTRTWKFGRMNPQMALNTCIMFQTYLDYALDGMYGEWAVYPSVRLSPCYSYYFSVMLWSSM